MLELCEQLGVDFGLDLLAAQGARPFKAEHQRRAPALQGLALLKVELAVVGAQIPGKPLIRDVVGALDQLAALAGAGVVAVKFNGSKSSGRGASVT